MLRFGRLNVEKLESKGDIAGLTRVLASAEQPDLRVKALRALARIGELDVLFGALGDRALEVRAEAARTLGSIRDRRAELPLVVALRDHDWHVRMAAAEALGQIGDAEAEEPLLAEFEDTNAQVRAAVAEALGKIGDMRAEDPLVAELADGDRLVRAKAAEALGQLGKPAGGRAASLLAHRQRRLCTRVGDTSSRLSLRTTMRSNRW